MAATSVLEGGQHVRDDLVVDVAGEGGMSTEALQCRAPVGGGTVIVVEWAVLRTCDQVSAPEAVDTRCNLGRRHTPASEWSSGHSGLAKCIETHAVAKTQSTSLGNLAQRYRVAGLLLFFILGHALIVTAVATMTFPAWPTPIRVFGSVTFPSRRRQELD
jgi:hypothetical protein